MEKIPFSDVAVKRKNRAYWWRKWRTWDLTISIGLMVHFHIMCLVYAPSTFSWDAFWVGAFLALVTSLFGVSISYHRNLAHRAFNLPKWLEYFFAYCGILAFQGDPMFWVSMHRMHHQYTDKDQDPHSPTEGFWFSHINWLFDITYINQKRGGWKNVKDLEKQFFYRFLRKTNAIHPFLVGIPLFWWGGFPMVVYGLYVRTVATLHGTFLINSACHIWGYQSWDTGDLSKNNWLMGVIGWGEGWHNNHHAFEFSARHGHEWWQLDMGWYVIKLLELVGLATHVKLPSQTHKIRMALKKAARD
ncbi:hypothetical protein Syun_019481 [Stephania yunnanensis]|uniref:Fatty acid desaturase domain-containing protein n=1 Tax=Stephania yunnanensis TaxID=152371 RepID=A0AAP0IUB5_9MAGN